MRIYILLSAGAILTAGVLHILRIRFQVPVVVGTTPIPMFLSYFGLAGSIGISVLGVYLIKK